MILFSQKAWADSVNTVAAVATVPAAAAPSTLGMLMPFALMILVFYFLVIRPQQKKLKEHEEMVNTLQKGEEVVTRAGIIGKIHGIADKFITLEVDHNVRIKVLKAQIEMVLRGEQKTL